MMKERTNASRAGSAGAVKRWLVLIIACVVIAAVLGGLKYMQVAKAIAFAESFPERSETVNALFTSPESWEQTYNTIGEVRATQYLELRTEVDGKIVEVGFQGGDAVKSGQLLLALDSSEEQAQLKALRAQLKLADLQLGRLVELRRKKLASKNDFDSAEADKDVLLANISALKASIAKKTLIAPFDAVTGLHTLRRGQYLAPNTLLTELSGDQGNFWVDFSVPQELATLSIGDVAQISARGLLSNNIEATVISADSRISVDSRSRVYRASLSAAPGALRPGAVVDVQVVVGSLSGIYKLPVNAVRRSNFGAHVYVLNASEGDAAGSYRAKRRQVTVASSSGTQVIVSEGLEPGELVASLGAFKLSDGLLTHVSDMPGQPSAVGNDNSEAQRQADLQALEDLARGGDSLERVGLERVDSAERANGLE
ncbi:MAG: efflux RND transporter periplasmic adaptor subunit [Pseudomonadales bacterium]